MLICLVRGRNFGDRAISSAPLLSSKALHFIIGFVRTKLIPAEISSCRKSITGSASRKAVDNDTYSLSVELRVTSVCNLDAHDIGIPAYFVTYPVRELAVALSSHASSKL
jgi:hypothetical protein